MTPIVLDYGSKDLLMEKEHTIHQDFILQAEPNTVFRFPANATKGKKIYFDTCDGDPTDSNSRYYRYCPVPLKKLHTVNLNRNGGIELIYSRAKQQFYLCAEPSISKNPQATARGATFSERNHIFFHQQDGVEDGFAPDMTGYFQNPQFLVEQGSIAFFQWGTIEVISESDRRKLTDEYNRLKSLYRDIPPTIYGKVVIPEKYWTAWQIPEGYTYLEFIQLPIAELFAQVSDTEVQIKLGCKLYICEGKTYLQFPREWLTFGGFLMDPKVINTLPHVRELLLDFLGKGTAVKIRKALCASV